MINKPRKQSMRQTVDEHSPTYTRAVEAIDKAIREGGRPVPREPAQFYRGARIKPKVT